MKKINYVTNIKNLPHVSRLGHNTRTDGVPRNHVYKVSKATRGTIYTYFKVQFHRGNTSAIKYFKLKREAEAYVEALRLCGRW